VKSLPSITFLLLGLALGLLASGWKSYTWKYEVDVTAVAALLMGGFIAVLIQTHASRLVEDGREEKKLLIDQLQRILTIADKVRDDYLRSMEGAWTKVMCASAKANLRQLSNATHFLEISAEKCSNICEAAKILELKTQYLRLKESATNGKYPKSALEAEELHETENAFRELSETVLSLEFEINRK
jgi:hypothetical protein